MILVSSFEKKGCVSIKNIKSNVKNSNIDFF